MLEVEALVVLSGAEHLVDGESWNLASEETLSIRKVSVELSNVLRSGEDGGIPDGVGLALDLSAGIDDGVALVVSLEDAERADDAGSEGDRALTGGAGGGGLDVVNGVQLGVVLRVQYLDGALGGISELVPGLLALAVLKGSVLDSGDRVPGSGVLREIQTFLDGDIGGALAS